MTQEKRTLQFDYYNSALIVNPNKEDLDMESAVSFFDDYVSMDVQEFLSKIDNIAEISVRGSVSVPEGMDDNTVMTLLSDNLKTELKIALNSEFENKMDDLDSFTFISQGAEFNIMLVKDIDPDKFGINDVVLLQSSSLKIYINRGEGFIDSNKKIED